jgi:hypothetical protein
MWSAFDKRSFVNATGLLRDEVLISKLNDITDSTLLGKTPIAIVVFGVTIIFFSLFGYIAAAGERRYLLHSYAGTLLTLLFIEVVAVSAAIAYQDEVVTAVKDTFRAFLKQYSHMNYRDNRDGLTLMWDRLMANYECCGVYNYTDFQQDSDWIAPGVMVVPKSCCILKDKVKIIPVNSAACTMRPTMENSYKDIGCYDVVSAEIGKHLHEPFIIACLLVLSEAAGIILACSLGQRLLILKVKDLCQYIKDMANTNVDETLREIRYMKSGVLCEV